MGYSQKRNDWMPEFIYFTEDEYHFGDIDDLAEAYKNSFYAGFNVEDYVLVFDPQHEMVKLEVTKTFGGWDSNDYGDATISIVFPPFLNQNGDEYFELTSSYVIDGRA